jgi:hypothetical protein
VVPLIDAAHRRDAGTSDRAQQKTPPRRGFLLDARRRCDQKL